MELDFSAEWRIVSAKAAAPGGPAAFAALELAEVLGRCPGCRRPSPGTTADTDRLIVLDWGSASGSASGGASGDSAPARGGLRGPPRYSWRAAPGRAEIYGEDEAALLRAAYDFLDALGARWPEPGPAGERLPTGPGLSLAAASRSAGEGLASTLALGHGCLLEDWEARLDWAARVGYSSVLVRTTREALALDAAPERLYEALRPGIAEAARRLGLRLELCCPALSDLMPQDLFEERPELFRMASGARAAGLGPCPSSEAALGIAGTALAGFAAAHPEVSVFHAWPDDSSGEGRCSCPECSSLSAGAQSLLAARALASALSSARPDASLSFVASGEAEDAALALAELAPRGQGGLPPGLELLWARRGRSWGHALCDAESSVNAAALSAFGRAAAAWREAGGGRVAVLERYEDALLFKGAVPPLASVIEGDLEAYRSLGARAIGILCGGGRAPLAPRPNAALLPRLAAAPTAGGPRPPDGSLPSPGSRASRCLADWAEAAYGREAAAPMIEYWRELEAAWAIDLDVAEGETGVRSPSSPSRAAFEPPADWGDPWKAGEGRLAEKRGRCEELFDHLRAAEARLAEAGAAEGAEAARREAREYAISGAALELNCARLSAYHELAAGDPRAAADIANLALSASGALRAALRALPDPRARRETSLVVAAFYDLGLRAIRRANARSGLRRLLDAWSASARVGAATRLASRAYEPRPGPSGPRGIATGLAEPGPRR